MYRTTKGGLRTNDVILRVNGKSVQTSDETRRLIDSAPVGVVRLVILPSKIRCFSPLFIPKINLSCIHLHFRTWFYQCSEANINLTLLSNLSTLPRD